MAKIIGLMCRIDGGYSVEQSVMLYRITILYVWFRQIREQDQKQYDDAVKNIPQ